MPTVKKLETLLSQMESLQKVVDQEIAQQPSIKMIKTSSEIEVKNDTIGVRRILLDGGASHDVYHSRTIPKGAVEKIC